MVHGQLKPLNVMGCGELKRLDVMVEGNPQKPEGCDGWGQAKGNPRW